MTKIDLIQKHLRSYKNTDLKSNGVDSTQMSNFGKLFYLKNKLPANGTHGGLIERNRCSISFQCAELNLKIIIIA